MLSDQISSLPIFFLCVKPYMTLVQNRLELICLGVLTVVSLASLELIPDPLQEFKTRFDQVCVFNVDVEGLLSDSAFFVLSLERRS